MEASGNVGVISNIHRRQNCIVRRAQHALSHH
jgi:hypothetical protein